MSLISFSLEVPAGNYVRHIDVAMTEQEARRTLAMAMVSIGRADDPKSALIEQEAAIAEAMRSLGGKHSGIARLIANLGNDAPESLRVEQWDAEDALPESAQAAFIKMRQDDFDLSSNDQIKITRAAGSPTEGYDFTYELDGTSHTAFALRVDEAWIFAPGPIGREDVFVVTRAFRRHFELTVAWAMHQQGVSDDNIKIARDDIRPIRVLWPEETDPQAYVKTFPLVFRLHNSAPNKREFYCGLDPMSGKVEPYDYL